MSRVDIIVPVFKPDEKFDRLIEMIGKQTVRPENIFLMVTLTGDKAYDDRLIDRLIKLDRVTVTTLPKRVYDHGGTRNKAVEMSDAEFILFMTQDAVPKDEFLIEKLLAAFDKQNVVSAYARQIAGDDAGETEHFTRTFIYPEKTLVKSKEDLPVLGIKTYLCSNACAMYRRSVYNELGGFPRHTIFNEDSIYAASVIGAGYRIAYVAEATVIHSHRYTYVQEFRRNFDNAVSHRQYHRIFDEVPSESEGIRLVKTAVKHFYETGKWYMIPDLIVRSGFKYMGYFLGKHYRMLPKSIVVNLSMNRAYWK